MHVMIIAGFSGSLVNFRGDLIKEMVRRGHKVTTVGPETGFEKQLQELGAEFIQIPVNRTGTNPFADIVYMLKLSRLFKKQQPDLVLGYTIKPVIYGALAAKLARVPRVFALITGLGFVFTTEGGSRSLLQRLVSRLYRTSLAHADKVFFQNPDDLSEFVQSDLVAESKTVLVNGSGVNLEWYQPQPLPPEPVFLMICRLLRDKGVVEYMTAARWVKQRAPHARFLLVGPFDSNPTGLQPADLQHFIDDGSIEYCGQTSDVRPFLRDCRCYVLPSYREGTPRTVLEAMATGRPIITTDAPGCRETVVDGLNGFLVPPRDANSLAERMLWMLENPDAAVLMADESLRLCREKYDVRKVNELMLRMMELWH